MCTRFLAVCALLIIPVLTPATNAQDSQVAFEQTLAQWTEINEQVQTLMTEARSADRSDAAAMSALRDRFLALQKQGQDMLPQMRATALTAYRDAPNANQKVSEILVGLAASEATNDQYQQAAEITDLLIGNQCQNENLYDVAGMAAFGMDQFEKAASYFQTAGETGQVRLGTPILGKLDEIRKNWTVEQEIRAAEAAADDLPRVVMETSEGNVTIELFENQAPNTVANFVNLVESGYYDGLSFHRVLANFMAQGGCPEGTGGGGPGYKIPCECEREDYRHHYAGTLSMAHAGKDTGGSQFFLTFLPTPHLDGVHTAFGRVIEGKEVLGKLVKIDPSRPTGAQPSKIVKATVVRKRDHEYTPKKVGE